MPAEVAAEVELADLLVEALDGTDTARVRYIVALIALRLDQGRDADLARIRESGIPAVVAL